MVLGPESGRLGDPDPVEERPDDRLVGGVLPGRQEELLDLKGVAGAEVGEIGHHVTVMAMSDTLQ